MIRVIGLVNTTNPESPTQKTVEYIEGTPEERARNVARSTAFWRNVEWLEQQWDRLLPGARGQYVAVANQQAFVAPNRREAQQWIAVNHPDDPGAYIDYVSPRKKLRTRAYQG